MNNGKVEYILLWYIENFSYCWHQRGEKLVSPYFTTNLLDKTEWTFKLFPKGCRKARKDFVSLFLTRSKADYGPEEVSFKCKASLSTQEGILGKTGEAEFTFYKETSTEYLNLIPTEYVSLRRKGNCESKDIVTVSCNISKGEGFGGKVFTISARTRIGVETVKFNHFVKDFPMLKPHLQDSLVSVSRKNKDLIIASRVYLNEDPMKKGEVIVEIKPLNDNHVIWKRRVSFIDSSCLLSVCGEHDYRFDVKRRSEKLPLTLGFEEILAKKSKLLDDLLCLTCVCTFSVGLEFEEIQQEMLDVAGRFKNKTL